MVIRVHELAKKLHRTSKELIDAAKYLRLDLTSHMSVVNEKQAEILIDYLGAPVPGGPRKGRVPPPKKVVKKPAKVVKKPPKKPAKKPRLKAPSKAEGKKAAAKKPKKPVPAEVKPPEQSAAVAVEEPPAKKPAEKVAEKPEPEKPAAAPPTPEAVAAAVVEKPPEEKKVEPRRIEKVEEKPSRPEVPAEKELPPAERPLTLRRTKKPTRSAKIIYRPGDQGAPPVRPPKKKRPTPQPLARIRIEPEEEGTGRPREGSRREREEARMARLDDVVVEVPRRPRVPFRRHVKPTPVAPRPVAVRPTHAELVSPVSIKDFSAALGIKANAIITKLMQMGIMANINQALDDDVVGLLAGEFNVGVTIKKPKDVAEDMLEHRKKIEDRPEDLEPRAPVVTFMGHVDHGKTSLLDAIRKANVVQTESGGITQHIGAYKVTNPGGKSVVFLDTPGHEAFTEMRARGANITDVAVLVVAADDGVMPQTEEAMNHAKEARVPIVVALNKMDLPQANPDRVKHQLSGLDLIWDQWGGKTVIVPCSALTGQGLEELVEMLGLEAELLELKANPKRQAEGTVIEARSSEGRGVTATVLVQNGTLKVGDVVLCGRAYGHVRAMYDDRGIELQEAGPSTPVGLTGLSVVPEAGDRMYVVDDLAEAKEVADERERRMRQESLVPRRGIKLEEFFEYMSRAETRELRVILKADVKGSIEVLRKTVQDVGMEEVRVRVLHAAVGGINESDVLLAHASEAIIIGFHVAPEEKARLLAEEKGVDIRLYQVIYKVGDEVKKAVEGLLAPEIREVVDSHVEVREIFKVSRLGTIAGCFVTDGVVGRQGKLRIIRDGAVIHDGRIETLRRFKDDVREVRSGFECGIKVAGFDDIKVGDRFETCHIEEIARKL